MKRKSFFKIVEEPWQANWFYSLQIIKLVIIYSFAFFLLFFPDYVPRSLASHGFMAFTEGMGVLFFGVLFSFLLIFFIILKEQRWIILISLVPTFFLTMIFIYFSLFFLDYSFADFKTVVFVVIFSFEVYLAISYFIYLSAIKRKK